MVPGTPDYQHLLKAATLSSEEHEGLLAEKANVETRMEEFCVKADQWKLVPKDFRSIFGTDVFIVSLTVHVHQSMITYVIQLLGVYRVFHII